MSRLIRKIGKLFGVHERRARDLQIEDMRTMTAEDGPRMAFYRQFAGPGELVFDVGANLGNRTRLFLGLGARVVAFEPQQKCADLLERAFARDPAFTLVRKALASAEGESQMYISAAHTVSTLSQDWVRDTTDTGRFEGVTWDKRQDVAMTTLDKVIDTYGVPVFIKIDVEGFEYEVLKGLSQPVNAVSIEFATESLAVTLRAIEAVSALAPMVFQIARGEELDFIADDWMQKDEVMARLQTLCREDVMAWGDVYMKRVER